MKTNIKNKLKLLSLLLISSLIFSFSCSEATIDVSTVNEVTTEKSVEEVLPEKDIVDGPSEDTAVIDKKSVIEPEKEEAIAVKKTSENQTAEEPEP
jgi:hypothetical protein